MVEWLNRKLSFFILSIFTVGFSLAQNGVEPPVYKDYKDKDQFEKFRKRGIAVGSWQIHKLKDEGALVVKLKTNNILIDQLMKQGNTALALEKQLQQFAINRNTMFAYLENFSFCKLYFIYSSNNDSLLNGTRQGIFLDTNLLVDPSIVMNEKFYLIAERDFAYTSSIGFIKEDSARFVKEAGNPIKAMAIVLKNKYGHQLKNPMPYAIEEGVFAYTKYDFPIKYVPGPNGATSIFFPVNRTFLLDLKTKPEKKIIKKTENDFIVTSVTLKKELTYERLTIVVNRLNEGLHTLYRSQPKPDWSRMKEDVKPFLY